MRRLATCVLAVLAVLVSLVAAPAAGATPSQLRYVALGDSYSAASGVLPPDLTAAPQCLRSVRNYPHVIAGAIGARLTDVTCGGADTGDFFAEQHQGISPQLEALSKDAQLVTMTIGGNDSGVFINSMLNCAAAGLATLGQGSPCKDRYGSSFEDTIRTTTYPALVEALRAVRRAAPKAEVAILGYPWIMPATGGCFDRMPIAEGDVPYLRSLQATLNDAVERAAGRTGVTFVDLSEASDGHDACQPLGVRWVEPVLQGTNAVIVHPNALGEAEMAARTMEVLRLDRGR
ncbi:SGNH/GDSL hydrolase family protein [Blastococcus saxobsidens]|uniref:Putative secreted hydrolase n=1 Tax=Blastococcus saxobsidens (strain DD2) TaxID=1146883 RepID=H6RW39_BLASD|nr:SGNH/GDSL hydrolase family protein [Blastococcus saxobsidens]CCG02056.1 Putative secreted hydrolase [Blastococcus saxobsidens DD2]